MVRKKVLLTELKQIEKKKGFLTARDVLEEARSEASILHELFDWDDTEAAEKYRLIQAGALIRTVTVKIVDRPAAAYWHANVIVDKQKISGYFASEKVLSNEDLYNSVLDAALRDIEAFQEKYKQITELHDLINIEALSRVKHKVK